MKYITITSKLSKSESNRLRRAAEDFTFFYHVGRNKYVAVIEDIDIHTIARKMMVIAGTTFEYEIS